MASLTAGLQSTRLRQHATLGQLGVPSLIRPLRCSVSGRSIERAPRQRRPLTTVMASDEGQNSGPGRLVRDALEFTKASVDDPSAANTKSAANPIDCQPGQLLGGKYKVLEAAGRGKFGVIYKAEQPGGGTVAIKAMSLRTMNGDWKQLELFEKEANALRSLSHSGIPAYKDYFEVDSDGDRAYFLVQELVQGKSLAQMVEAGWKPSQQEVERIANELLSTFAYLQKQQVVHRDVKPENIILEGGKPGGKLFLVDFGGIQQGNRDAADSDVLDTGTLVGTYGYMAPEQLRGAARPASDLFALGGTLLYLISGEAPSSFPQRRLKLDFNKVDMSPRLARLLEGLLEPTWEDRLTATEAKAVLAGSARASQQQQARRQEQRGWNPFSQDVWEDRRQRSRGSDSRADSSEQQQEPASTSGRLEPEGLNLNNAFLALAAAALLPAPLRPLVAFSLPFLLSGKASKSRRRNQSGPYADSGSSTGKDDSDWMTGRQHQQQRGFGFSDGPAEGNLNGSDQTDLTEEEQEALRQRRRRQQMAAWQQQQMLLNMMRMMGGGYRGFGGPFGMGGGFRRGPFMF